MGYKGQPKTGGRSKGTPNKKTIQAAEIAERLDCDPFEVLILFAKGDAVTLGLPDDVKVNLETFEEVRTPATVPKELRLRAATEATKYVYPQRKAVENTNTVDPKIIEAIENLSQMGETELEDEIKKELKLVK